MTGMLASVTSLDEALVAMALGADIIDLKNPSSGALGALPGEVVGSIVHAVGRRRPLSATSGDIVSMEPRLLVEAVEGLAGTGVDFVKVGLFPAASAQACVEALAPLTARGIRIVAVLFADRQPDFHALPRLAEHGFAGVMLDTANKTGKSLRHHLSDAELGAFVKRARSLGLIAGLAGSLSCPDVAPLLQLAPDYLGFRGALCVGSDRNGKLNRVAFANIRQQITGAPRDLFSRSGQWFPPSFR